MRGIYTHGRMPTYLRDIFDLDLMIRVIFEDAFWDVVTFGSIFLCLI